jgi:hypothetical protein
MTDVQNCSTVRKLACDRNIKEFTKQEARTVYDRYMKVFYSTDRR